MAGSTEWTVGWKLEPTGPWGTGTPATLGAGNGVLIESESMPDMVPEGIEDANVGDALVQGVLQGNRSGEGNLVVPVRYEGIEYFLAAIFGDDTKTTAAGESSGTARLHTMLFQDSLDGIFGTLAHDKNVGTDEIWEYPYCKPSQFALNHGDGKLMSTVTLVPNTCARSGQTNGSAELAAATPPSRGLLALFNHLTVLLKETTDGGTEGNLVDPTDEICVTNAQLSINRNVTGIPDSCQAGNVGEPQTDGLPEVGLILSTADYNPAVDAILKQAQIRQPGSEPKVYKASLIWTGKDIPGSDASPANKYALQFDLPAVSLLPGSNANASGAGARVPVDLSFRVRSPQWTPDGADWSWVTAGTMPMRALLTNENDTDVIA